MKRGGDLAVARAAADAAASVGEEHQPGRGLGHGQIAGQESQKLGLLVEEHPVTDDDYHHYGNRAYYLRNERMALLGADLCLAFWDGHSRGTSMMVDLAEKHGIEIELYCEGRP